MQDTVTRCLGLISQYNPLSIAQGSLVRADNAIVSRENTIENRRGSGSYAEFSSTPAHLLTYSDRLLVHYSTKIAYDNGSGTFADYSGSYSAPSGYRIQGEKTKGNLYVTTSSGIKVFTDVAGTAARSAGAPRALDPEYALNAAGTGFLADDSQCAYRVVVQRTDANSNVLYGYPSQRLWVTNSAGASKNIDLTLYLSSDVITNDVVQFYRTTQVSGVASDSAGDEMKLAYQATVTSTDISNGYITFTDTITDALLGATLYTSPSQEGIAQANAVPPLAKCLAYFKNFMFYSNTSTKQRLFITLVGTSGLSGNTITLGGVTYNFGASEIVSGGGSPQVKVFSAGVAATDIDNTARSLVKIINRYASNTSIYAYYLSGPSDLPGQIMLEEKSIGGSAFTAAASNSTISEMFFPPPPTSGTNARSTSSNDVAKNRAYFAKADQPEHVPLLNYVNVGPSNSEILRTVALRDSLMFITTSGVYRLTGETSQSFSVVPLDLTVICKAKESIATLANQVFMLSNQGVVSVSDAGVQVISREIEDKIRSIISLSNLATYTVGASYESERMYLLSTVQTSGDVGPVQTFVYNVFTRCWTRWTFGFTSGLVETSLDKLFMTKSNDVNVYAERKSFSDTDYADPESDITITAISGETVTFTVPGTAIPEEGWAIKQGSTSIVIDELETSGGSYVATMLYTPPASWAAGAAEVFPSVGFHVEWNAWSAKEPALLKHVRQYDVLVDQMTGQNNTTSLVATFKTDIDATVEEISIDSASYKWGAAPWGSTPWGGTDDIYYYPTWIPQNKQYCRLMSVGVELSNANEKVAICGYSLTFDLIGERVAK